MVNRAKKLYGKLSAAPKSSSFRDLCKLAEEVGFIFDRQNGSHLIYLHPAYPTILMNFQPADKGKAKPKQVRQLLDCIEFNDML